MGHGDVGDNAGQKVNGGNTSGSGRSRALIRALAIVALLTVAAATSPAVAGAKSPSPPAHKPPPPPPKPKAKSRVSVVLTSANLQDALTHVASIPFSGTPPPRHTPIVQVRESLRYQRIKGVGGAMTDTSAWLMYDELPPGLRAWLMRRLFGPGGINLRFLRIPIGASDFTANRVPYTYDDVATGQTDFTLAHFSILHDIPYVIPALKQALAIDPHAFVVATPWSPPAWMKTNDRLGNSLNVPGFLRQVDYSAYAQYFVKFLQAYAGQGVHVDAIAPQNEPGIHTFYPGLTMNAANEAQFVAGDLEPALRAARLRTKIYGYDSNWFPKTTGFAYKLIHSAAAADLTGISSHCYYGEPTFITTLHLD